MPVYDLAARKQKGLLRRRTAEEGEAARAKEDQKRTEEEEDEDDEEEDVEEGESFDEDEEVDSDEAMEDDDDDDDAAPAAPASAKSSAADAAAGATRVEFSEPAQWVERMALTSTRSLPSDLNADDDPKREEAFIQQTLLSVTRGISLLEEAKVPWKRPDDYYAEMYKSDVHMNDVRQAMEASKARIEAQAHRRSMKEQKKYGKEVQAEVLRQRAKYKRDMQDSLSDWRKKRRGNGSLQDMLNDDEDGERDTKRSKTQRTPRAHSVRPGGSKRPGKNARRRR
ncbi:Eukaryotic rRNA processing protein EBP2 [Novymonas esmeraldas]|uniref:Eukaryotic rRNA processing protein EBP2 n=1 Tax=Novymonas esmeraldas TaxID=1808958 RepID=A0AAW0EUQ7_9TRYP